MLQHHSPNLPAFFSVKNCIYLKNTFLYIILKFKQLNFPVYCVWTRLTKLPKFCSWKTVIKSTAQKWVVSCLDQSVMGYIVDEMTGNFLNDDQVCTHTCTVPLQNTTAVLIELCYVCMHEYYWGWYFPLCRSGIWWCCQRYALKWLQCRIIVHVCMALYSCMLCLICILVLQIKKILLLGTA